MDNKNMPPEITPHEQEQLAQKKRRSEIGVWIVAAFFGIMFLGLLILDIRKAFFRGRF
jgi:hypothetical protein